MSASGDSFAVLKFRGHLTVAGGGAESGSENSLRAGSENRWFRDCEVVTSNLCLQLLWSPCEENERSRRRCALGCGRSPAVLKLRSTFSVRDVCHVEREPCGLQCSEVCFEWGVLPVTYDDPTSWRKAVVLISGPESVSSEICPTALLWQWAHRVSVELCVSVRFQLCWWLMGA